MNKTDLLNKMVQIPGRLTSVAIENIVCGADEIYDDTQQKDQATINSELIAAVGTGGPVDEKIAGAVNTEKTRAEEAEGALDGRVGILEDALDTDGSVDSRIFTAVATETTRAQGVETTLQTNIDAEATRAQAAEVDRYTKAETYNKNELNNMITTPNQRYTSVTATAQTTAVIDLLPATGEADTTYRVGNWDGTQYNDSVFSEYAWNGSAYIKLSTKSQIGEVYDISANHADTKYADLAAALGTNGANIPQSLRKGGMSIKFVQSSDNKYVQYRLMSDTFNATPANWRGADEALDYWKNKANIHLKQGRIDGSGLNLRAGFYAPIYTYSSVSFGNDTDYLLYPAFLDEGLNRIDIEGAAWVSSIDWTTIEVPSNAVYIYHEIKKSDNSRIDALMDDIFDKLTLTIYESYINSSIKALEVDVNEIPSTFKYPIGCVSRVGIKIELVQGVNLHKFTFKQGAHYFYNGFSVFTYVANTDETYILSIKNVDATDTTPAYTKARYLKYIISSGSVVAEDTETADGEILLAYLDAISEKFEAGLLYEMYLNNRIDRNTYGYWHGKDKENIYLLKGRIDGTGSTKRRSFYVPIYMFSKFEFADTYKLFPDFLDEGLNRIGIEGATWSSLIDWTTIEVPSNAVYAYAEIKASDESRVDSDEVKEAIFNALQITFWHKSVENRFTSIENNISDIEEDLQNDQIRPFFLAEMNKTIQDCNDVMDGNCFVATIVTDNHAWSNSDSIRQTKDNLNNLEYFSKKVYNNAFIHLGDIVHQYENSELGKTDKEVQNVIGSYLASYNKLSKNVLVTSGNHDGHNANTFTQAMWQATQNRADGDNSNIHVNANTMDFYWDCQKSKLRLIFIAMPNVSRAFKYSWNTLQWLKDVLESVEDTWNVIIFSHVPYLFKSYIGEEGMENKDIYVNICNAFNNHTSYTIENFSVDFTNLQDSKILCQVFGHNHSDKVWAAGESYNGFYNPGAVATTYINELNHPFVQLGCTLFYNHATTDLGGTVPIREDKTVTQDLWTVMIYRPDQNKIYFKRFGAGDDMVIDV